MRAAEILAGGISRHGASCGCRYCAPDAISAAFSAARRIVDRLEAERDERVARDMAFESWDEDITREIPFETLAETSARWNAERLAGEAQMDAERIARSERPTRDIKSPRVSTDNAA
jgi:hypothetical protein